MRQFHSLINPSPEQKSFQATFKRYFIGILGLVVFLVLIRFSLSKTTDKIAVIVLGGGLTADGQVPTHTQLRLDKAAELYRSLKDGNHIVQIITLSGGTPHKPNPRDSDGFAIWEASAAAKRLLEMGIESENVLEENFSLDTIGNVSFTSCLSFYFLINFCNRLTSFEQFI
jgi:uncharacterized SAM-binding protein YcdF (DUF218 family)